MKKTIITIILSLLIFSSCNNTQEEDNTNLCVDYANQELTASRISVDGGEKQYSINGVWVKESILFKHCKKKE